MTQIQDLKSTTANISKFAYGYDNRDVKTYVERVLGMATQQKVDYTYDDIDQLLTEISNEATPQVNNSYNYDAAQNRTASTVDSASSSFTINNVNQISAYTLSGSPVTITHDDNGNTTQLGPKDLTWDDANRLTSVTVPGVSKSEYQYDGLNRRRIAKAYTWNSGTSDWDLQGERRFIYDGMDLIEERDGSNNLVAFYTRTGNIGELLSRTTPTNTSYYHYDGNGNVVSLSDASENVVAEYVYDAYGNTTSATGTEATNNPIRYSTKYFDTATGLYDYGFRFYDPITGRWLNHDPIGEGGGLNLYGFVGNNPGNKIDGYGLTPKEGYQAVLKYRKDILSVAKDIGIQPLLLAGVVYNEMSGGNAGEILENWHGINGTASKCKFMVGLPASLGITQYTIDPYDWGLGQNVVRRGLWLNRFLKNIPLQLHLAGVRMKDNAMRHNRYPNHSNKLSYHEMSIVLTEYNRPETESAPSKAAPSPYGKNFLKWRFDAALKHRTPDSLKSIFSRC